MWELFRTKFKSLFSTTSPESAPSLGDVKPTETVARFLVHDRHFSVKNNSVKAAAFEPDSRGEKSVFRVDGIDEAARWNLGVEQVEAFSKPHLVQGRGDFFAREVSTVELAFAIDPADHFRHTNIVGWPSEKSQAKLKAAQLALKAKLVMRPVDLKSVSVDEKLKT